MFSFLILLSSSFAFFPFERTSLVTVSTLSEGG